MKRLLLLLLVTCTSVPPPAKQNPSPMVDSTRLHQRVQQKAIFGTRFTIDDLLPKPVEVLITPVAAGAGRCDLVVHFHGAAWLPLQAAVESGRPLCVAAVNLGAGSGRYAVAFADPEVFRELVARVAQFEGAIYLTAFSAGYGAVREILTHQPETIAGVLLLDGLHTSYIPEAKPVAEGGRIDAKKLEAFRRFAERAARGEARFVITHSEIFPGTFASTTETADDLLVTLSMRRTPILAWGPLGMQQLSESRRGSFAVLGFAGNTAPDHVDHLHALGTFLQLLWS